MQKFRVAFGRLNWQLSIVALVLIAPSPVRADTQTPPLSEIKLPANSAQLLVQTPTNPANIVLISGVRANPTDTGVEIILETTQGEQLQVINRSSGNNYIADIPNTQLRLPNNDAFAFRSENPTAGITEITVTNLDANTVRVAVIGEAALPTVELFDSNEGLIFGVVTATSPTPPTSATPQEDDSIEIVVTGEQDEGYNPSSATTATRTDTPLRDIPQSIQVVPQQVLRDRNVRDVNQAVETVSGVSPAGTFFGVQGLGISSIRGFSQGFGDAGSSLRNGTRDGGFAQVRPIGTVEQVEVLKGPGSVLFGALEPGGVINVITKQPLSEPYYNLAFEVGNYGYYQPTIDFSGPLNDDKTLLYRFIASYQGANTYQEFVDNRITTIAPSITLKLGDRTSLNVYYEYADSDGNPAFLTDLPLRSDGSFLPRYFYAGYPELNRMRFTTHRAGYAIKHEFSDNLQIRNNFAVATTDATENRGVSNTLVNERFLTNFNVVEADNTYSNYFGQIDLLGKFNTGPISHQVLIGFDFNRFVQNILTFVNRTDLPPLDLLNLNYDIPKPELIPNFKGNEFAQSYGVYLQDQIAFSDNLKLLIGGRYDWASYELEIDDFGRFGNTIDDPVQNDGAFSPRIGLVYQPNKSVSLYTSYSSSFGQSRGFNPDGEAFKPTRGTQYEVGVKADFLDGRLSTTLAAYHLTKTNVTTPDPDPARAAQGFSVQVGEQRSQGIELDVAGEILPGWKIIASYAYTDAEVTEDNVTPVGNRLPGIPTNQASLWTTYEIQTGNLRGLGFGLGLFYVGAREGDSNNSFQLKDYIRTDAALYYRQDGFKAAINIRNLLDIDYAAFSYDINSVQRGEPFTIIGSISLEL